MLVLRLAVALIIGSIFSAAAAPKSPLLARLNLRTCEDAFSPVREQVLRDWFASHAGHVSMHVNGGRDLDDEAGGRRAFSIDETLERLGEQPAGRIGRRAIEVQRWQLELGTERLGANPPKGLVPTLLGDRLRIDVGESRLLGGEFIVGIHWEPPADLGAVARLHDLTDAIHRRRAFAGVPMRVIQSGEGAHGEVYILLDTPGDAGARFLATLSFVRELSRDLFAPANH